MQASPLQGLHHHAAAVHVQQEPAAASADHDQSRLQGRPLRRLLDLSHRQVFPPPTWVLHGRQAASSPEIRATAGRTPTTEGHRWTAASSTGRRRSPMDGGTDASLDAPDDGTLIADATEPGTLRTGGGVGFSNIGGGALVCAGSTPLCFEGCFSLAAAWWVGGSAIVHPRRAIVLPGRNAPVLLRGHSDCPSGILRLASVPGSTSNHVRCPGAPGAPRRPRSSPSRHLQTVTKAALRLSARAVGTLPHASPHSGAPGGPSDDPIFALNREATGARRAGEPIVNATVGALLDDDGKLAILPTAARAVHEVPADEWAAYAPIAGSADFLSAVIADLFGDEPALRRVRRRRRDAGRHRRAAPRARELPRAGAGAAHDELLLGAVPDARRRGAIASSRRSACSTRRQLDVAALDRELAEQLDDAEPRARVPERSLPQPDGLLDDGGRVARVVECLVEHAGDGAVTLLLDMAYFAYAARADPRAFLAELAPLLGKVGLVFAWSASKSFTHYGLRVGAIVACVPDARSARRPRRRSATRAAARGRTACAAGMAAITRLLTEPAMRASSDAERAALKALLTARAAFNDAAKARGLKYPRYEGGFFVTVFTDDAHERAQRMKEEGVFVVPRRAPCASRCARSRRRTCRGWSTRWRPELRFPVEHGVDVDDAHDRCHDGGGWGAGKCESSCRGAPSRASCRWSSGCLRARPCRRPRRREGCATSRSRSPTAASDDGEGARRRARARVLHHPVSGVREGAAGRRGDSPPQRARPGSPWSPSTRATPPRTSPRSSRSRA